MSNILTAACNRATLARESAGRMLVDGRFVGIVLSLFTHTKKENPKMQKVPILRFVSFRFVSDDRVFFATNVSSIFTTNHPSQGLHIDRGATFTRRGAHQSCA